MSAFHPKRTLALREPSGRPKVYGPTALVRCQRSLGQLFAGAFAIVESNALRAPVKAQPWTPALSC
jgi:hypothetical protein